MSGASLQLPAAPMNPREMPRTLTHTYTHSHYLLTPLKLCRALVCHNPLLLPKCNWAEEEGRDWGGGRGTEKIVKRVKWVLETREGGGTGGVVLNVVC